MPVSPTPGSNAHIATELSERKGTEPATPPRPWPVLAPASSLRLGPLSSLLHWLDPPSSLPHWVYASLLQRRSCPTSEGRGVGHRQSQRASASGRVWARMRGRGRCSRFPGLPEGAGVGAPGPGGGGEDSGFALRGERAAEAVARPEVKWRRQRTILAEGWVPDPVRGLKGRRSGW